MADNFVEEVKEIVEVVVSQKVGELKNDIIAPDTDYAKTADVDSKLEAMREAITSVEKRFQKEHDRLFQSIKNFAQPAMPDIYTSTRLHSFTPRGLCAPRASRLYTNTSHLCQMLYLCNEVTALSKTLDSVSSSVSTLAAKVDGITSDLATVKTRLDTVGPLVEQTHAIVMAEEEKHSAEEAAARAARQRVEEARRLAEERVQAVYRHDLEALAGQIQTLRRWTGREKAAIVYDSEVDAFTDDGIFAKLKNKPHIAVIGFTTDGDVFGGYYSVPVKEQNERYYDPSIFAFSFESRGRCRTPRRFPVVDGWKQSIFIKLWKNDSHGFVLFWVYNVGGFCMGNLASSSYCNNMSRAFQRMQDTTLTGDTSHVHVKGPYHHCMRLIAIQFE